jgi:hypothetical protein
MIREESGLFIFYNKVKKVVCSSPFIFCAWKVLGLMRRFLDRFLFIPKTKESSTIHHSMNSLKIQGIFNTSYEWPQIFLSSTRWTQPIIILPNMVNKHNWIRNFSYKSIQLLSSSSTTSSFNSLSLNTHANIVKLRLPWFTTKWFGAPILSIT